MNIINGLIEDDGERRILMDGAELKLEDSLKVFNHSPSGYCWGYSGSGAAQTALAILLHVCNKLLTDPTNDPMFLDLMTIHQFEHLKERKKVIEALAVKLHQDFKSEFVSTWPIDESLSVEIDVVEWVAGKLADLHRKEIVQ